MTGVKVIPITTTAVRVEWRPLTAEAWSGDPVSGGYRVEYRPISEFPSPMAGARESAVNDVQVRDRPISEFPSPMAGARENAVSDVQVRGC